MANTFEQCLYKLLKTKQIHNDTYVMNGFVSVRCPFCGDSKKSATHTHLYVKVRVDKGERQWYKCQRCGTGGVVDSYLMDLLNLYDQEFDYLKGVRDTKLAKYAGNKGYRLNNTHTKLLPPLNNKSTKDKLSYLENRLGIKLEYKDILDLKIITNFYDFFNYNNIKNFTRKPFIMDGLDSEYIGFLTTRNEFINARKLGPEDKYLKRYINYNIFGIEDDTRKLYTIRTVPNVMKKVKIVMAEGVFDIISIYFNLYNKKQDETTIYCAVLGMGYQAAIQYFMKLGFIFADYEIYSDEGIPLDDYRRLKRNFGHRLRDSKMTICYNTLSKDCGVPKDKIKLKKFDV